MEARAFFIPLWTPSALWILQSEMTSQSLPCLIRLCSLGISNLLFAFEIWSFHYSRTYLSLPILMYLPFYLLLGVFHFFLSLSLISVFIFSSLVFVTLVTRSVVEGLILWHCQFNDGDFSVDILSLQSP